MFVRRNLKWRHIFHYAWKSMLYFALLSISIFILHKVYDMKYLTVPFNAVATLSTALAIFLGFKNNNAYDRWWEARKIWGLMVNYSRAWAREVPTMIIPGNEDDPSEVEELRKKLVYRHIAFVNALRVFLRIKHDYNKKNGQRELYESSNKYLDIKPFITDEEYSAVREKNNPPNYLLQLQGNDLKFAFKKGWLTDFRFVRLDETLIEFNNIQGRSERIKNTPFPRPYSFFSRIFVFIHGTLLPFAFVEELGWINIPLSIMINFVYLMLDLIGERTEDPFENRMDDIPLTSLSITIEDNLKEQIDHSNLPEKHQPVDGIVF